MNGVQTLAPKHGPRTGHPANSFFEPWSWGLEGLDGPPHVPISRPCWQKLVRVYVGMTAVKGPEFEISC